MILAGYDLVAAAFSSFSATELPTLTDWLIDATKKVVFIFFIIFYIVIIIF